MDDLIARLEELSGVFLSCSEAAQSEFSCSAADDRQYHAEREAGEATFKDAITALRTQSAELTALKAKVEALENRPVVVELDSFNRPYFEAGHDLASLFEPDGKYQCVRCKAHQIDLSEDLAYGSMRKCAETPLVSAQPA